jgi:tetratricopeptide (TPR) repeat protein
MSGTMPGVQAAIDKAKQEPNNFEAQLNAGDIYYKIQRYDQAIEFFKKANQLQPDNYEVLVHLGNSYFDTEKYEEAEKWYSQALAKKSEDTNVRTDLGLTFMFRSAPNYDRAIQEFQKSLSINPNHIQALQNLTVAYTKKGDAANAKATLAKLESVDATNTAIARLRDDINKISP